MHTHTVPRNAPPADLLRVTELFRALADPTRLQIVLQLRDGERSVRQLMQTLGQPQSTVSRHLGLLRAAHLVQTRRAATSVYYRLADHHLGPLLTEAFSHAQHERLGLPAHDRVDPATADPASARVR